MFFGESVVLDGVLLGQTHEGTCPEMDTGEKLRQTRERMSH